MLIKMPAFGLFGRGLGDSLSIVRFAFACMCACMRGSVHLLAVGFPTPY